MTKLFVCGIATIEYVWAPSSNILPEVTESLDSIEGSGDSEDPNIGASIGVNLKDGTVVSCSTSQMYTLKHLK